VLDIAVMAPPRGVFLYLLLALKKLERVNGVNLAYVFYPFVQAVSDSESRTVDLYKWWRRTFHFSGSRTPMEAKRRVSEAFPHLHPMPLELERCSTHGHCLSSSSAELLSLLDLDVLLNLHTFILRGRVLEAFPHGVWSYHHGDPLQYRGTPPGFWELYDGAQRTGAIFQRLGERLDDGEVLRQVDLPTISHDYCAQRQALFAAGIDWPAEVAREIVETGEVSVRAEAGRSEAGIRRRPKNWQLVKFALQYGKAKVRRQLGLSPY